MRHHIKCENVWTGPTMQYISKTYYKNVSAVYPTFC